MKCGTHKQSLPGRGRCHPPSKTAHLAGSSNFLSGAFFILSGRIPVYHPTDRAGRVSLPAAYRPAHLSPAPGSHGAWSPYPHKRKCAADGILLKSHLRCAPPERSCLCPPAYRASLSAELGGQNHDWCGRKTCVQMSADAWSQKSPVPKHIPVHLPVASLLPVLRCRIPG